MFMCLDIFDNISTNHDHDNVFIDSQSDSLIVRCFATKVCCNFPPLLQFFFKHHPAFGNSSLQYQTPLTD